MTDISVSPYFRVNWRAWRILGGVDLNARRYRTMEYWRALALNILITAGIPICLMLAMFSFELPLENVTNFNLSIISLSASTKFLLFVKELRKITELEQVLAKLDNRIDSAEERRKHAAMHRELRMIKRMFIWAYSAVMVNAQLTFIIQGTRSLPLPAWFPLDWQDSLVNYVLALAYQLLGLNFQILQNFVVDLFPPLVLCTIANHCEILIERITNIGYDTSDLLINEERLIACLQDLEELYRVIDLALEIISLPMLVEFVVIAIDVGLALCGLVLYVENTPERIYFISLIFGLALQIFPICYYGTVVEYRFRNLPYAVFNSNWVDQSPTYRKTLVIFAERTQRVPKLVAGNMIPISLTTFLANCKAAYSLFTLIADSR